MSGPHRSVDVVVSFIEDGGHYPRAHGADPSMAYWHGIAVMAATLRIVGRDWPITVSTNRPPTEPRVRGVLDRLGVTFRDTAFDHRPPEGYYDRFSGSFYLLDALADAVGHAPDDGLVLVVDPDCVWVRDPAPMVDALDRDPELLLAYEITYAPGQPALGLTQEQMGALFGEVGAAPVPATPPYAGGEFLFGRADRLAQLLPHVEDIWQESLRRFDRGDPVRANTEEHVLSYALGQLGWTGGTANPWMRRLWTEAAPNRTVQGDEEELVLWHVLTEKGKGLTALFEDVVGGHPAMRSAGHDYRRHLARRLRVRREPVRWLKHLASTSTYRLRGGARQWPAEW